jgi:WhiB family redox-sensing transcriptional regulator
MKPERAFMELAAAIKEHGSPICQEIDGELWFPESGGESHALRQAKQYCEECPVKVQCLNFALANREEYGIWGGLTVRERQKLRGQRLAS